MTDLSYHFHILKQKVFWFQHLKHKKHKIERKNYFYFVQYIVISIFLK